MDAVLDPIDLKILRHLGAEGRLSNIALADRVGLSPSACLRRVQDLERRKVITGYRASIDAAMLGITFVAYVTVGLSVHSTAAQTAFVEAVSGFPEVTECHNVTGSIEYLLRVETRDLADYKRFHSGKLGALEQVSTITTMVVMASPKDRG